MVPSVANKILLSMIFSSDPDEAMLFVMVKAYVLLCKVFCFMQFPRSLPNNIASGFKC